MDPSWTETRHERVAVLTFTRPPRNWMNVGSMSELADHLATVLEARRPFDCALDTPHELDELGPLDVALEVLVAVARGNRQVPQ